MLSSSPHYQVRVIEPRKPLEYERKLNGLVSKRSCTDVFCCVLFGAFIGGWIVLAAFAIVWGNPEKLINPTDSLGRICGAKTEFYDLKKKPYLLFFDMTKCFSYSSFLDGCQTPQVCVERCPDYYFYWPPPDLSFGNLDQKALDNSRSKLACTYDVNISKLATYQDIENAVFTGRCARYYVKSTPITGRCIPSVIADLVPSQDDVNMLANLSSTGSNNRNFDAKALNSTSGKNFVKVLLEAKSVGLKILADLQLAWWQILIGLLVASIAAFLWVMLMRWIAAVMIYLSMTIILIASGAGSAYCWWQFVETRKQQAGGSIKFHISAHMEDYLKMSGTWLMLGIICSLVFSIFFFSLVCLCGRIRLAIALIGESSKAVAAMLSTLFFPIIPFILQLAVFTFAVTVAVYLASSGRPNCQSIYNDGFRNETIPCDCDKLLQQSAPLMNRSGLNSTCQFVSYNQDPFLIYMQLYNLFGLFWALFFVHGLADVTLAGAFASYYWAFNKPRDISSFPVVRSFWTAVRYHLGSIAFGALILAIVRLIRVILEYLDEKLKRSGNPIAQGCLKCMQCLFWCLEKFLKFLSKNAYIMIAIYGRNFCVSAREAFTLMLRNALRYLVLNKTTDFLLFLGKMVITAGMGAAAYFYFSGGYNFNEFLVGHLNYYFVPIIIIVIGTYFICSAFFDVYDMAVDTTFLCFLEDCERNDGSAEKPYYMANSLKRLLDKHNEPVPTAPPIERF